MTLIESLDSAIGHCGECLAYMHEVVKNLDEPGIGSENLRRQAAHWGMDPTGQKHGADLFDFKRKARYDFVCQAQLEVERILSALRRARSLAATNQVRQAVGLLQPDLVYLPVEVQNVIKAEGMK